jgi:hypothetical protein
MIFAFLFLCLLAWLLYRFRLSKASSRDELRPLILPGAVFSLFFLGVAFFALLDWSKWYRFVDLPLTTTVAKLTEAKGDVVIEGRVSQRNSIRERGFAAYIRSPRASSSDENAYRDTPKLLIELADGSVSLDNDNYETFDWHLDDDPFYYYYFLRADDPVVITGYVVRGVSIPTGEKTIDLHAQEVFVGSHAEYVTRTREASLLPSILSAITMFGSLAGSIIMIAAFAAVWRTTKK